MAILVVMFGVSLFYCCSLSNGGRQAAILAESSLGIAERRVQSHSLSLAGSKARANTGAPVPVAPGEN